jgi:Lipocalin-like domain
MMRQAFALASMLLIGFATFEGRAASIDYDADLVGVWKLQTFSLQILGEQSKEVFGRDPIGYLIFTAEGRMMTILTRADRKPGTTIGERAELLQSMVSYTGRYKIEDNRIRTKPDVAWNEVYSGTEQIRFYVLDGDTLSIRTAEQLSGILPGKKVVATLTYVRER